MAPLPKRRWSTRRQGKRRATFVFKLGKLIKCINCGELIHPHRACPKCGYYKGQPVVTIKTAKSKKNK